MLSRTTNLEILLVAQLAASAPTAPLLDPEQSLTLNSAAQESNFSLADLGGNSNGNCASSIKYSSWKTSGWVIEDCYSVVNRLVIDEVLPRGDEPVQFVERASSAPQSKLEVQRTPRKYVSGSCVLTIMMLDRFHPGQLPDGKPVLPQKTDISTYRKVYAAAKAIEKQCTEVRYPGWATIGDKSAMGVFIWARNSDIDDMTGGIPVISTPISNTSAIASEE